MTSDIEWADQNISPYPGCLHGCPWCYAAAMTKRWWETWKVDKDFKPTWKPERLPQLAKVKAGVVFVNGMGDLFGAWVPDDRLMAVVQQCLANPYKPTFVFLTKNPARYLQLWENGYSFPLNSWLGVTLELGNEDGNAPPIIKRVAAMAMLDYPRKLISFEPMDPEWHAHAKGFILEIEPGWVMVGTEKQYKYEHVPDSARLQDVVHHCQSLHVPVFVKDRVIESVVNHGKYRPVDWPREFPAGVALATKAAAWHPKEPKKVKRKPKFETFEVTQP